MQKFCLETSFLIDFLRGKEQAVEKYKMRKAELVTTSIVALEILRGAKLVGRVKEYKDALKLLERLTILPFTLLSSIIAVNIEFELRKKKK